MGKSISERFIELYKDSGLSQEKFGAKIGMGRGEVANIVYGKNELKKTKIPIVADRCGVREEWLCFGELPKERSRTTAEGVGAAAARAAKHNPEDAKAFFERAYADLGEEGFLLMYELFRKAFPQYDKPPKD